MGEVLEDESAVCHRGNRFEIFCVEFSQISCNRTGRPP